MSFAAESRALEQCLIQAVDRTQDLQVALADHGPIASDMPNGHCADAPHLVSRLDDDCVELMATLERAREAAVRLVSGSTERAATELSIIQESINFAVNAYVTRLVNEDTTAELNELAQRLGADWPHWRTSVRRAIQDVWTLLNDSLQTTNAGWSALKESPRF